METCGTIEDGGIQTRKIKMVDYLLEFHAVTGELEREFTEYRV